MPPGLTITPIDVNNIKANAGFTPRVLVSSKQNRQTYKLKKYITHINKLCRINKPGFSRSFIDFKPSPKLFSMPPILPVKSDFILFLNTNKPPATASSPTIIITRYNVLCSKPPNLADKGCSTYKFVKPINSLNCTASVIKNNISNKITSIMRSVITVPSTAAYGIPSYLAATPQRLNSPARGTA